MRHLSTSEISWGNQRNCFGEFGKSLERNRKKVLFVYNVQVIFDISWSCVEGWQVVPLNNRKAKFPKKNNETFVTSEFPLDRNQRNCFGENRSRETRWWNGQKFWCQDLVVWINSVSCQEGRTFLEILFQSLSFQRFDVQHFLLSL